MPIGNQITYSTSSLNAELGERANSTQTEMRADVDFFERINALGVAGLEAIGFSPDDAQKYFDTANALNTIAQIYFGQATQAQLFQFDNATAKAR